MVLPSTQKKIEVVYVQYFQKDKFVKGDEAANTTLLNVAEPQGVFLNAEELKECLVNSFKQVDPCCKHDDLMKKFGSICTDGASSNIGCKNSLCTQLKKDYPHIASFRSICHRLEVATGRSEADG